MRRADSLGLRISNNKLDELRYTLASQLKHRSIQQIEEFFVDEDNELIRIVNQKLEEFFEQVGQMRTQGEQAGEKKAITPNAMLFEHFEIDHKLAQQRATQKSEGIEILPNDAIK